MSAPPKTVIVASAEEEAAIRAAVREGRGVDPREHAVLADAPGLAELFSDPAVGAWIYDSPRPPSEENVLEWVKQRLALREKGERLLLVTRDDEGGVAGYSEVSIWPERASGELVGGVRADRQNRRSGGVGMRARFDWMFEVLGLRLICLTAALDNIRSQKLIDGAGFVRLGERDGVRPDGSVRRSLYWEMSRERWREMRAQDQGGAA